MRGQLLGWSGFRKRVFQLAVVGAALAITASAGADQSYTDAAGDAGAGVDITKVSVSNDASGNISIRVQSASPVVAKQAVAILMDIDRNPSTGGQGVEVRLYDEPAAGIAFFAFWNGSTFIPAPLTASFSVGAPGANLAEFRFNKNEIQGISGFNFQVVGVSIDGANLNVADAAPDSGSFSYDLTVASPSPPPPKVRPVIGAPAAAIVPQAGKRFSVTFTVTRSDNGSPLTNGIATCTALVALKAIACGKSLRGGVARLTLLLPKTAKGKKLMIKLTIKAGGQTVSKTGTFHIR